MKYSKNISGSKVSLVLSEVTEATKGESVVKFRLQMNNKFFYVEAKTEDGAVDCIADASFADASDEAEAVFSERNYGRFIEFVNNKAQKMIDRNKKSEESGDED